MIFKDLAAWLRGNLISERQRLDSELALVDLPLLPAPLGGCPTIRDHTRCALERLRDVDFNGYRPGLSKQAHALTESALKELIIERTYRTTFPMASLHGCASSKTDMWTNPARASCRSMAEMGALVKNLGDLEGKHGAEIISACMEWGELRLYNGIKLLTDTWHKRFYWLNEGGSHHMAVLCYELQRQHKEWCPDVQIHEYGLNLKALDRLRGSVSIFVVALSPEGQSNGSIFKPLPGLEVLTGLRDQLGVEVLRPGTWQGPLSCYELVVVDHSKTYASVVLNRLEAALANGQAIPLTSFLEDIQSSYSPL